MPREALYRMAHLWTLALLDDRFETLLLPVLVTEAPLLDRLPTTLPRAYFRERLESGACLLFIDGPHEEAARWPKNLAFHALQSPFTHPTTCPSSS